ncbi:hypothetical protein [Polymorphobacter fuscus]|uniref:Autotransporter domain-containing protein n=1 Tax=Sandarakinorhabdus fusca TaxID=1439888 RepID=A0A7C9KI33_9SPHN|nr:hypothetical protein [Polymorphobacter fuscus]KAB7647709.1 hypothetical protein F9290_06985 [Polymorphobacter fuscus]MQT17001.1 hypothetical protein [Polymorphobacter fuscus]
MKSAAAVRRKSLAYLRHTSLARLLGATALATLVAAPALSRNCSNGNPPAPAPAPGAGASTSGPAPVSISLTGAVGCNGETASYFGSGNIGGAGQGISPSLFTMPGGSIAAPSGPAILLITTGGAGGNGSGDSDSGINTTAGSGGVGGGGGDLTVTIGSGATLSANGTVISVQTVGGAGGVGATGYYNGSGGAGGGGGAISNFNLAAGTSVTATGAGAAIVISSLGGTGGQQHGSGRPADNIGKSAGAGGAAGAMTIAIDGAVSSITGDGINVTAQGGNGGSTGNVTSGGKADGTKGGDGGNGAASITFETSGTVNAGGTAVSITNAGGYGNGGAYAGAGAVGHGGTGGAGGNAGGITAGATQRITGGIGVVLAANGGTGGNGGSADGLTTTTGGGGGAGGTGGSAALTAAGSIIALTSGIVASADGGAGGGGASAGAITSTGGNGGVGGVGGLTTVTLSEQTSSFGLGVQVSANGGNGGSGGKATSATDSNGGSGGTGGAGGSAATNGGATVNLLAGGSVTTQGQDVPSQTVVIPGILVQANGGVGGASGSESAVAGQAGGAGIGGGGGLAVANIAGNVTTSGSYAYGVMAQSVAGVGGGAGKTGDVWSTGGATGGQGGNGGTATVSSTGGIVATAGTGAMGIIAQSIGGGGGAGGNATSNEDALGGDAGAGGNGGTATLTLAGTVITRGSQAGAALSQSIGGSGGVGGSAYGNGAEVTVTIGGNGNSGGIGGVANATNAALLTTFGAKSGGLMAQSVGGGGGNGGAGVGKTNGVDLAVNVTIGGNGGNGGSGGQVTLANNCQVTTYGTASYGVKAETVGGGGGDGGAGVGKSNGVDLAGNVTIGGKGGNGGSGGQVTLTNNYQVTTYGTDSYGVKAQTVGGGGGEGGTASGNANAAAGGDANSISMPAAIGGSGGSGGQGTLTNNYQVATYGTDSYGVKAQAVGGGGGEGGTASGNANASAGGDANSISMTAAIGGSGGGGGDGGTASGNANAAAGGDANSISMPAAIGGSGGSGGDGSTSPLLLTNYGFVATAGDGGIGLMAHNIAGGGGNGGDSSAAAYNDGTTTSNTTSITLGMGGSGGVGGTGGQSTLNNKALVLTLGESAYGMLAQSIGGGGGQGSGGDSSANTTPSNLTGKFTVTLGGNGGGGGTGGSATGDNAGGIATAGDGARGMMVQSIGGGGGAAGGAVGKANGSGGLTIEVTLGGTGGTGGTGGAANGSNHFGIVTTGADADGMFVQSVGGGGGSGGKAASTNGGAADASDLNHQLQTAFQKGLNLKQTATLIDGTTDVYQIGDGKLADVTGIADLQKVLNSSKVATVGDGDGDGSTSGTLTLNLKIGNNGGKGGNAGTATAYNEGAIRTTGGKSDGIFVQSVGGGGGAGGAVTFTDSASNTASVVLGGQGGAAGDGNSVLLTNAAEAEVYTAGATANALVAQSIGGGGGKGGITASKAGALSNLTVTLGGSAGSAGSGQDVTVNDDVSAYNATTGKTAVGIIAQSGGGGGEGGITASEAGALSNLTVALGGAGGSAGSGKDVTVNNDVSAYIATTGKNAVGIIAQSGGGGGGITSVLSKDQTGPAGDPDPSSADLFGFHLTFGDTNASTSSDGGTVTVGAPVANTAFGLGAITTSGRNAYGVFAQSIGGGGGLVQGGNPSGTSFFGTGTMRGNGNTVSVTVGNALSTSGIGGVGVFAQSIGGGGGLVGDTGWTQQRQAFAENGTHIGNGGNVTVTVAQAGSITTSAPNTPAIWAQSIGGGGGLVNTAAGPAYAGSAGGTGTGGTIDINVDGKITVTGIASNGILAQSLGDATSTAPITVTIGATGNIQAGIATQPQFGDGTSAGVYIDHGGLTSATPNKVTNNGTLYTYAAATNSVAVWSTGGYTQVFNNGTMGGDILLQNNGGQGCFSNGTMANGQPAVFDSGDAVTVGGCGVSNLGTINIKGSKTGTTTITGNYTGRGTLVFDADFAGRTADRLVVNGDAVVHDTITVKPASISNHAVKLLSATGTLSVDPALKMADTIHLYDFKATAVGTDLMVAPVAAFAAKAAGLGANEQSVAANLQSLFDGNASADAVFNRLLTVKDDAGYVAGLQSLAGQGLGAFGAFRFNSSRTFAANLYGGCQDLQLESRKAGRCAWGRVLVNNTVQTAGTDTQGYHADSYALQKGFQLPVGDNLALIGSTAYENTKFRDGSGSARITGDSMVGGIGLLYTPARLELSAGIDAAYGWYNARRTITLGLTEEATAKPRQSQIGGHLRAAIDVLGGGEGFVRPFVEGHAIHVSNKAFTETGTSPFRLAVEGQSDTALIGVAGVELGTRLALSPKVTLRPFASAAIEYGSPRTWTTTARFADQMQGASFDLKTAGPGTLGRFSVGADLIGSKNVAFSVQYAPEFGKDFASHSGTARLTIAF